MPWGKLDDSFYDHPKLDELGRDRLAGAGLWAVSISWCNKRLTDGHVTFERIARLGGTTRLAERLADVGLYERVPGGYLIHDFLDFNDSREMVEARREAERIKKRSQRAAGSASVGRGRDGRYVSPGDTPGESPATRPDPSRPVQEIPPPPAERGRRRDGTNPRATGSSPRQNGHAPRDLGESPRQIVKAQKRDMTPLHVILARSNAAGSGGDAS